MIQFTEKAIDILKSSVTSPEMVRISVKGGGCSGFLYDVKIEPEPRADDTVIEFDEENLKICIDPQSSFMLSETTVDYEISLVQSGFKFTNKSATKSCGCGKSFS
jgi:iron-sulfur cluster assembly protein|tara:strand:+ start:1413 stop:1727 length:315 start_codon:yes stop_codon:yes gene_type:complete